VTNDEKKSEHMFRFFAQTVLCCRSAMSHEPSASNPLTAANADNLAPQNGWLIREQPPEKDECRGVAAAANPRNPNAPGPLRVHFKLLGQNLQTGGRHECRPYGPHL
jgi:hypothetical protein